MDIHYKFHSITGIRFVEQKCIYNYGIFNDNVNRSILQATVSYVPALLRNHVQSGKTYVGMMGVQFDSPP